MSPVSRGRVSCALISRKATSGRVLIKDVIWLSSFWSFNLDITSTYSLLLPMSETFDHRVGAAFNRTWLLEIFLSTKMMLSHNSVTQWLDRPFLSQHAENACCPAAQGKLCPGIRWWHLVFISIPMGYIRYHPRHLMAGGRGRAVERCSVTDC